MYSFSFYDLFPGYIYLLGKITTIYYSLNVLFVLCCGILFIFL